MRRKVQAHCQGCAATRAWGRGGLWGSGKAMRRGSGDGAEPYGWPVASRPLWLLPGAGSVVYICTDDCCPALCVPHSPPRAVRSQRRRRPPRVPHEGRGRAIPRGEAVHAGALHGGCERGVGLQLTRARWEALRASTVRRQHSADAALYAPAPPPLPRHPTAAGGPQGQAYPDAVQLSVRRGRRHAGEQLQQSHRHWARSGVPGAGYPRAPRLLVACRLPRLQSGRGTVRSHRARLCRLAPTGSAAERAGRQQGRQP